MVWGYIGTTTTTLFYGREWSINMTRILSKGSRLDFADFADWDDPVNIRDYDVAFVNLRDLEQRKDEFLHKNVPEQYKRMYELPPAEHVLQLLTSGGDLVITLPNSLQATPSEDQDWEPPEPIDDDAVISSGTPILNFFSWLPFALEINDDGGESIAEETISEDWDWYFQDGFSWNLSFPKQRHEEQLQFKVEPLVENRYGEGVASKVVVNRMKGSRTIEVRPSWGTIYLLPMLDGWGIEQLAEKVMECHYPDVELEIVGGKPNWLTEYEAPREKALTEKIQELQQELAAVQTFKQLLWEQGDPLEEVVYNAFRRAGLTIEEEVPNRRDGAISLDNRKVMIEITGTTGGVTESKLSQLNKWVINNQDEYDKEVTGLFVINYSRDTEPADRRLHLDPDRMDYLENSGLQLVTTLELFKMVHGLESDEIDIEDVERKLLSDAGVIQFDEVNYTI